MVMKSNAPTVSVIIPTYNRAGVVGRAIQSVLHQTFQDFELIVVDDGSLDNTREIVREFQKQDRRITYIGHNKNKGGATARNTGIRASRGKYIAFLDSDDEWLAKKLEKQLTFFEQGECPELGVVYTGVRYKSDRKGTALADTMPRLRGWVYSNLLWQNRVGTTSTPLIKKSCFNHVGLFDEQLPSKQDRDMWIRIARKYTFDFVDEQLVVCYLTRKRISTNLEHQIRGYRLWLKKYAPEMSQDRTLLSCHYYKLATFYFLKKDLVTAIWLFLQSLCLWPLATKYAMMSAGRVLKNPQRYTHYIASIH